MLEGPIFFDSTGRRSARIAIIAAALGVVVAVMGIAFAATLFVAPRMAGLNLTPHFVPVASAELTRHARAPGLLHEAAKMAAAARARREAIARALRVEPRHISSSLATPTGRPLAIGFYESLLDDSFPDLKRQLPHLDVLMPAWLALQGQTLALKSSMDPRTLNYVRSNKPRLAILPVIQNATLGQWDGPGLGRLLHDPDARRRLETSIEGFISTNHFQGLTVDFEGVLPETHEDLKKFLSELGQEFVARGWITVITAPFNDPQWPYAEYARLADYTVLMGYDEHSAKSGSGSVAGENWYEDILDKRMKELSPSNTIVGIGNYGYDWSGADDAQGVTFQEAALKARDANAQIVFDDTTNNPHFSYIDDEQVHHDVWFLDAVTAFNEIHAADIYHPVGYALWRIGSEDPSVWSVFGLPYGSPAPRALHEIETSQDVDFEGSGEILRVEAEPTRGSRDLDIDAQTGDIDDETYKQLPTDYVVRQFGNESGKVAISFDDGPDPIWTPKILDILKAKHVRASFFIIGANAEAHPGLVERILAEGHEIGNHTFTHPNLADTPPEAVKLELNATQRLFEALTGRSMRLFRPPYIGDAEPGSRDEIIPVQIAQDLGYVTVGLHADPGDWQLPGADKIITRALAQVNNPNPDLRGHIVLLHDSGGDRSQTVAALPGIIDQLRSQNLQIVPVSEIAGLNRDQAMPKLSPTLAFFTDRVVFFALSVLQRVLYFSFFIAIWLGIGRLVFLGCLSIYASARDRSHLAPPNDAHTRVSVVIPAFNEEKVIAATVNQILNSDYRNLEVVVVDDGSLDNTSSVFRESFAANPRVKLFRVANGGKAKALNFGITQARGEIVVALDADTHFNPDTISRLVRWFADPSVAAVAGNAKVGNRINMVTRWQALEYIVAQNLERRALAALGTLTVVPGAVGAWRKTAIQKVGGFQTQTLAEDQDLTIALQQAGYRVHFDPSAIAWTEAPTTFRGLAKQRFRWAYGTLQCLWKYRTLLFNPRSGALGLVALPLVWLFQIILAALGPLADLLLVWQLLTEGIARLEHGSEFSNGSLVIVGIYYAIFVLVDLLTAAIGLVLEKREDWRLIGWLVLQRFGYRQLMYYVVVRSILTALHGPVVGWGKLERTGTVTAHAAP